MNDRSTHSSSRTEHRDGAAKALTVAAWSRPVEEIARRLEVAPERGLSGEEARRRLADAPEEVRPR